MFHGSLILPSSDPTNSSSPFPLEHFQPGVQRDFTNSIYAGATQYPDVNRKSKMFFSYQLTTRTLMTLPLEMRPSKSAEELGSTNRELGSLEMSGIILLWRAEGLAFFFLPKGQRGRQGTRPRLAALTHCANLGPPLPSLSLSFSFENGMIAPPQRLPVTMGKKNDLESVAHGTRVCYYNYSAAFNKD